MGIAQKIDKTDAQPVGDLLDNIDSRAALRPFDMVQICPVNVDQRGKFVLRQLAFQPDTANVDREVLAQAHRAWWTTTEDYGHQTMIYKFLCTARSIG